MTPKEVLRHPARLLSDVERQHYFDHGYVVADQLLPEDWLQKLRAAAAEIVERSRGYVESDTQYIIEEGHSAQTPRLKRLTSPVNHHPTFWAYTSESPVGDMVADVVGPDVKFYHDKLNFKWSGGGAPFHWHQDIPYWPHTNYSPVTVGVYLEDCDETQGPLTVVKGSHEGELFSMYDAEGRFISRIEEHLLDWVSDDAVEKLTGPAGTVFLLNCRTIHGSRPNDTDRMRPLLLTVYSSADAFPYRANPLPSKYDGQIVRGQPARYAHHDPRPCEIPPDWSGGYDGPWKHQADVSATER